MTAEATQRTLEALGTVPALLEYAARVHGDTPAVVEQSASVTYTELRDVAHQVAGSLLAMGVGPGDRVGIWAPNDSRWVFAALGTLCAGATLVPISTRYRGAEAADILGRSRCRVLFTVRGFLGTDYPRVLASAGARLPDLAHTVLLAGEPTTSTVAWTRFLRSGRPVRRTNDDPDRVSDILFTSGTTGRPKGVLATHGQTLRVYARWTAVTGVRHGDRYLLINPFSHTFGYKAGILASILRGATMVPVPVFDPGRVLELLTVERISVLLGPPTLFTGLLDDRGQAVPGLRSLRLAGTGGSTVPERLVHRIRDELRVPHVFTAYGLTESLGVVSVCPPDADAEIVAGTAGPALPGTETRIGARGEILVRGANVMRGYLDNSGATREAIDNEGWLHTGDAGSLNADGYLRVTDRLKDMFIVGGFNAYPAEIERVLAAHPAILDVAVVGEPHERLGEVGVAYVVLRPGTNIVDGRALTRWAGERMAGYKVPRRVVFVDDLPRDASGKVRKHRLRG